VENKQVDQEFLVQSHEPLHQTSLFPTAELTIPDALKTLKKSVSAIHAVPIKADQNHTLNTRRLFDACIVVAQLECNKMGREKMARVIEERISPAFDTRISQLMKLAGISGKNYERVKEDLQALYEMDLRWNVMGEDKSVLYDMRAHFLSSLGIGLNNKQGYVRFSLDPDILAIVLEPSQWASLSLQAMHGLKSASSLALYQNCWKYINTQSKLTAAFPTETWIELLVGPSRYISKNADGKVVISYKDFKRRVLLDAISRVNEIPALQHKLVLKEIFSGNRVARLQFRLEPKKQLVLSMPMNWGQEVVEPLKALGLDEQEIVSLSEVYSLEVVAESLRKLSVAIQLKQEKGQPISSRKAYFQGILDNIARGATEAELNLEQIEREAQAQESQRRNDERKKRNEEEFGRHQIEKLRATLFEWPQEQREALLREFEQSEEGKRNKMLWERGWAVDKNLGAYTVLKLWLTQARPELFEALLPQPEDRTMESWLAWRLEQLQGGGV
jgi:hypothetical protein